MGDEDAKVLEQVGEALASVGKALDAIEAMASSPTKTAALAEVAQKLEGSSKRAIALRRDEMRRLYKAGSTSLRDLGRNFRMSHTRAGQILDPDYSPRKRG